MFVHFRLCVLRLLERKTYRCQKGSRLWKIVFIKTMFEKSWWGDASLTSPHGSAPARTDNKVSYYNPNQPIWLQYGVGQ